MQTCTQRVTLVFSCDERADILRLFEEAFQATGLYPDKIRVPPIWNFDRAYVRNLRSLVSEAGLNSFTILHPPAELLLQEADLLVPFSAYRSWYDPERMKVIPHLWTPIGLPKRSDELVWSLKPPLAVGFMGRTFRSSTVCKLTRSAPMAFRKWLLSGKLGRNPVLAAALNEYAGFAAKGHSVFPRLEAIDALESGTLGRSGCVELIDREGFSGSEIELADYRRHLKKNTYVLCPRGTENYSYRIYETLAYGRVPVIIDTDTVLPDTVNWRDVALVVPYEDISRLNEIIIGDYESHSSKQFKERQARAFAAIQSIHNRDWLRQLVNWVGRRLRIQDEQ